MFDISPNPTCPSCQVLGRRSVDYIDSFPDLINSHFTSVVWLIYLKVHYSNRNSQSFSDPINSYSIFGLSKLMV